MTANDVLLIIAFICLIAATGYTVYNIYQFMPIEQTCEDDFAAINRCGCVPCNSGLVHYFKVEKYCEGFIP